MSYQPPRRNVTYTDERMISKDGEHVTVRRCFEDGKPTATLVYINGWCLREYKTAAGLARYLDSIGALSTEDQQP